MNHLGAGTIHFAYPISKPYRQLPGPKSMFEKNDHAVPSTRFQASTCTLSFHLGIVLQGLASQSSLDLSRLPFKRLLSSISPKHHRHVMHGTETGLGDRPCQTHGHELWHVCAAATAGAGCFSRQSGVVEECPNWWLGAPNTWSPPVRTSENWYLGLLGLFYCHIP